MMADTETSEIKTDKRNLLFYGFCQVIREKNFRLARMADIARLASISRAWYD